MSAKVNETLVDVRGAAMRLGCDERFIRRLVQERRIPFFKLGGSKIRFSTKDLEAWLEKQRISDLR